MDLKRVREDFPILKNNPDVVYLDSAATSQKPKNVIKAVSNFYENYNSNVHRGIYDLSQKATDEYEKVRGKVAKLINSKTPNEIIFTKGTSESINIVAHGWAKKFLKKGDVVVVAEMEHHSNIVCWQQLKKEIGIKLFYLPITKNYELDYGKIISNEIPKNKIKLVTLTHASNVLGIINPIAKISKFLKKNKINVKILVDGAQSVPHTPIDVKKLGCDFFVFSSHKMLGPSGVGVLWAKQKILDDMDPMLTGSSMIETVTKTNSTWADVPGKFEVGTPNLEGVIGLGAAIDYLQKLGMENVEEYERKLTKYALDKLTRIKGVKIYGNTDSKDRLGVISFAIGEVHPHDVGEILNRKKICVRTGHHCAQPLMKALGVWGTTRASLYIYNTKEDIDKLCEGINDVKKIFKI